MVTLAGVHGDVPGTTEDEVLAFARSLLSPAVAQLIERVGPAVVGGVVPLPVQPAPALREGALGCCRGSSRSATRRAASTRSTGRAWRAPPCRPTRSARRCARSGCVRTSCHGGSTAGPRRSSTLPGRSPSARTSCIRRRRGRRRGGRTRSTATSCGWSGPARPRSGSRGRSTSCSTWWSRRARWLRPSVVARVLASSLPGRRRQAPVGHPRVGPPS